MNLFENFLRWEPIPPRNAKDLARVSDRRPPSPLGNIQPDHWLAEYTTELLNVLNVLGLLVQIEPRQVELLERICSGPTLSTTVLAEAGAFDIPAKTSPRNKDSDQLNLFN